MKEEDFKVFADTEISRFRSLVKYSDLIAPRVSSVPVGWHLFHMLKVINGIYRALEKSSPEDYKWKPNAARSFVWTTGWMKRGAGKSPKSVRPPEQFSKEDIDGEMGRALQSLYGFGELHPKSWFKHYVFGPLDRDNAFRFVELHTRHHLSIIQDILDAEKKK